MTSRLFPGLLAGIGLLAAFTSSAAVINDGTTTANLQKLSNSVGVGDADASLTVQAGAPLLASQTGLAFFPLQSVWYAGNAIATTGVYTVSAEFQPSQVTPDRIGGVMGWLNLASSNGIAFQVFPENSSIPKSFQVAVIDFSAQSSEANVSVNHLFNPDGSPATADFGSAWANFGTNYTTTNLATFQLEFSAPTAGDLVAVPGATARLTATVFQGVDASTNPVPAGTPIQLITDLSLPTGVAHRFGYSAVWLNIFSFGEDIGFLDTLSASGGIGVPPNTLPTVSLTTPANGSSFAVPTDIVIIADATDTDGTITTVDFLQGTTLLGTATSAPYSLTWSNVPAGSYVLTAVATDNFGGASTSAPVGITVTQSGEGPSITVVQNGQSLLVSWGATGYQLQMKTNLLSSAWFDIPDTLNVTEKTVPVTGTAQFFRLVGSGTPTGPRLSIQQTGNLVTLSWPSTVTGYRLESATSLSNPTWTPVPSVGNQATETVAGPAKYYRLVNP